MYLLTLSKGFPKIPQLWISNMTLLLSRYGVGSQLTPTLEVLAVTRDITDEFTDVTFQAQTDLEENSKGTNQNSNKYPNTVT